ncbi:uncharacterized protein ACIQIH_015806 isoform 1-T2 [Cyanocitta cristata]
MVTMAAPQRGRARGGACGAHKAPRVGPRGLFLRSGRGACRARRSPRRRREPRAPSQAGDEGTSAACAGRPEPLPGPRGHCEGRSGVEPWGDLKLRLQLTVKKCVMRTVVWFAPSCLNL